MKIYLKSDAIKYKEELVSTKLKNENGQWKVFHNYEEEVRLRTARSQAYEIVKEGNKFLYKEDKDYVKALAKFKEAQNLAPGDPYFQGLVHKTQEKVEQKKYSKLVQVTEARVGGREKDEFGIFGTLNNTGHKVLSRVQVTASFLGDDGKTIMKKSYHPVLFFNEKDLAKMKIEWQSINSPLEPNAKKKFGFKSDIPDKWKGKLKVEVTEVGSITDEDLKEFRERQKK